MKKKVHMREITGQSRRGMPFGRWKDKVKEYMYERGADRERVKGWNKQKECV